MKEFLSLNYLNNSVMDYLVAAGIFVLGVIIVLVLKKIVLSRLRKWSEKTEARIDDFLVKGIQKTIIPLLFFGAFYIAITTLQIPAKVFNIIRIAAVIISTFLFLRFLSSLINFALNNYFSRRKGEDSKRRELRGISTIISIIIWIVGLIFLLDNLGFNVASVIAGLGIGGIAIALAAQAVLGDFFSYFVIFFDRPFEIGDFINVEDNLGSIEYIGLKTTRIRSLSGEQLIFSNSDLVNSRIRNYKRMEKRRVVFKLGLIYQTKSKELAQVPQIVKSIIEESENVVFDRGHFASYGDFSLNFEFVYYVMTSDYTIYMNIQQDINLKIYDEFEKRGIEFAYPTQTLFMNKENWNGKENKKSEIV